MEYMGYGGFPIHFTPCSPSPNQITMFFSYKNNSWGVIWGHKKENKKTLPKSFPSHCPRFASCSQFWPQHSPPAILPMQPFLVPLMVCWLWEYYVGLMHLDPWHGILDLVRRADTSKGCNLFILNLNKRDYICPKTLCLHVLVNLRIYIYI